jgi:hypothetical protein
MGLLGTTGVFDSSVIVRSGQRWKALILLCGFLLSAFFLIAGFALFSEEGVTPALCLVLLGAGTFACSMLFACSSIRCPHCGARWIWIAITRADAVNWIFFLVAQRVCQTCDR